MESNSHGKAATGTAEHPADNDPSIRAVGAWVQQFARTLKNCRLYDPGNATVLRFRQQLVASLHQVIRLNGGFTLRFGADDVTCDGVSLYPARSRDDNLALPFYRDGIRSISFAEGVEPREIDALVAGLLRVTGTETPEDEDLVTVLWESQLPHITIDYIPAEGDVGVAGSEQEGELVPWPTGAQAEPQFDEPAPRTLVDPPPGERAQRRSDDWSVGEPTTDFEAEFALLQAAAPAELERFRREFEAEHLVPPVSSAIAIAQAFMAAETNEGDLPELAAYLPRVLRIAVQAGLWDDARGTVALLHLSPAGWSSVGFVQELQQPGSIQTVRSRLLEQTEAEARAFTEFVGDLGEFAVDVLGQVMAEMDGAPQAKPLTEAIVERCRTTPERLAPWIADRRPNVVRNVVQMLGAIGGNAIVGPLQSAIRHPDARIRAEVLQALRTADTRIVKPLLLSALPTFDSRSFIQALQKLGETRDSQVAQTMLMLMIAPEFDARPAEEKHAIYSTLGSTGGDEVIAELEAELLKGGWFERVNESHRQTIARCLARIGTPMARMVLENGAKSRRAQVRDVCVDVLSRWEAPRG
jgi:hypothetical protein